MRKVTKESRRRIHSRAGFTLVELIVVMVILAILTTVMTPTMFSWIDRAKKRQILIEARNVQIAAMAVAAEEYAAPNPNRDDVTIDRVAELAGVKGIITKLELDENFEIAEIVYTHDGFTATFDGDEWTAEK